jgi:dipeptidyl aminopeptidase/acylaminoacyl peptidase
LSRDARVDIKRAAAIGHSAGGHLALWLGGKHRLPKNSVLYTEQNQWLIAAISLAGVTDLSMVWKLRLGDSAVGKLIGRSPDQYPKRYVETSPLELLPMGLKQVLIHGRADEDVPISQSERFVQRAKAAGDGSSLVSLDGFGHLELKDPESRAWDAVVHSTLAALEDEIR